MWIFSAIFNSLRSPVSGLVFKASASCKHENITLQRVGALSSLKHISSCAPPPLLSHFDSYLSLKKSEKCLLKPEFYRINMQTGTVLEFKLLTDRVMCIF